jgi:hypothetical protein
MAWHKRVLSHEADRTEWYMWDDDGNVALQTDWNVTPIVEATKGVFNTHDRPNFSGGDWFHVASIPYSVVEDYKRKHGKNLLADREHVRHWVNDPDNRCFRTRPGRV